MPPFMSRLMSARFRSPEGDDKGGGGDGDGKGEPDGDDKRDQFPREYVRLLREESKGHRLKAQEQEQLRKAAEDAAAKTKADSEAAIAKARTDADARVIRSEVRAEAVKAGMIDLDGIKLLDLSKLKLDDDGNVVGVAELIEAAKKAKPYLFGDASTSSQQKPPKAGDKKPKLATEMTPEEYKAARAAAVRGR